MSPFNYRELHALESLQTYKCMDTSESLQEEMQAKQTNALLRQLGAATVPCTTPQCLLLLVVFFPLGRSVLRPLLPAQYAFSSCTMNAL